MTKSVKVLICHNYYQTMSGEDLVITNDIEILRKRGIEVVEYTRSNAEINDYGLYQRIRFFFDAFYSWRTIKDIKALVNKERPDVALVQNVFPLISPSLYHVLHRLNVPVVQLVYNYRFVCANGILFTHGKICERCIRGSFINAVVYKCYKQSRLLSALYGGTIAFQRHIAKLGKKIDAYVTPDLFLRNKLREGGYPAAKMFPVLNPFDVDRYTPCYGHEGYFVYFGRIVREKGIFTLIDTMKRLSHCELVVVGGGEAAEEAQTLVKTEGLTNIRFTGPAYGEKLISILNGAIAVVVPTQWYDNSPLVVHQSFALGKPVIASDIDGIPEIVKHEENGLLCEPGNDRDLAEKMLLLRSDEVLRQRLSHNARRMAEEWFTAERRFNELMKVVESVVSQAP